MPPEAPAGGRDGRRYERRGRAAVERSTGVVVGVVVVGTMAAVGAAGPAAAGPAAEAAKTGDGVRAEGSPLTWVLRDLLLKMRLTFKKKRRRPTKSVAGELPFLDSDAFYRFFMDTPPGGDPLPTQEEYEGAEDDLHDAIDVMNKRAPHATLRYILRKPPHERSDDDLEMVYDELMRIRALSHLGNSVRRELAHVIVFESHPKAGEVLFQQGDEGHSWYIILRGSVDVVIHGKGVVTTLAEGDDFGKLALINDAPRAASIVLREPNCHFLRVDKDHFNRILRDVEANTVRLKEHGQDVLVLEKISNAHSHFKYTVMAGTSQKMLEHLLETRLVGGGSGPNGQEISSMYGDPFLEDFLLTHIVFMPTQQLVSELARHYRIEPSPAQEHDFVLACKRRVVQFVNCWVHTVRHPVFDDPHSLAFLEELVGEVEQDAMTHPGLQEEASLMHHVTSQLRRYQEDRAAAAGQKWKLPPCGQPVAPFSNATSTRGRAVIRPSDDIIFRVYCADHTYCTLRCPVSSTAEHIKLSAADKLKLGPTEDLVLVEVRSSGERVVIADTDLSVPTGLGGLNARLFVAPREHIDALTPLPEQEGATEAMEMDLELFSMKELAYHMTLFDWDLFWSVHEYELLYKTFGRQSFNQITANLDVFLRRFNEIQYWVITEVCLATQLSKRVSVLRKMIKLAQYCRDFKNLNALFAIVMGLGNVAVSRLSLTWEKLPSKSRKLFTELEALIDPTRNHRAYRIAVGRLSPPVIPFMPLLIKDMTFTHEGNKTFQDGHLVNFEKMHMLAQTMRSIRNCRSRHLVLEPFSPKCEQDVKDYIASLRVIDNARTLSSLSQKLEPRRS